MSCPGIIDTDFLGSVLRFADCEAQTVGMQGYQALAASNSPVGVLLTGLLTIMIAFFGYRMLTGHVPDSREGIFSFVRIGLVLALATSWAAYRVVLYDVALRGPAEIVGAIGGASDVPGATGGLVTRLGEVDRAMVELSRIGVTGGVLTPPAPAPASNEQTPAQPLEYSYEPATIFGPSSMGSARLVFLTATIAAYGSVRLVAGLLLAIGPLFIIFLLFDGTRSLFEGWIRALAAAAIGALAVTMTLGIELALLEPWLADLLGRRYAGLPTAATATELLVISLAFALILLGALGMAARVALGFRLPFARPAQVTRNREGSVSTNALIEQTRIRQTGSPGEPSRAAAVAEAVAIAQRREARDLAERRSPTGALIQSSQRGGEAAAPGSTALGQSGRRRAQNRISTSARKRDVRS
ncbi:type IV secretion system protein [Sphingomonas psychrotolerans]|uniref:Type IV secretion system protein n=1 Tax=Sphingomonas psychrotolerans TaxID=1327635 RepID=A0ABU3N6X7_9SPHN|nr:type IV secretion system protein [Sphingomonas psychrotolerans]MDT8760287.1 type IV secretion system protein [Sphingomonas psychrotolerans]